jgi:hypothetical protein
MECLQKLVLEQKQNSTGKEPAQASRNLAFALVEHGGTDGATMPARQSLNQAVA